QTRAPQHLPKTRPTHARPHARIRTLAPTDRSHPPPSPAAPPRSPSSHTLHATRCTRAPTPRLVQRPYHQTPRARPFGAPPRQNSPTPCAADRPSASPPNHARAPDAAHARHQSHRRACAPRPPTASPPTPRHTCARPQTPPPVQAHATPNPCGRAVSSVAVREGQRACLLLVICSRV